MITWRRLSPRDFPLLMRWLAQPHVARWWNHETSAEAVERDFGPSIRGEDPSENLLALLDGAPFGLVQRSRLADAPDYLAELSAIVPVAEGAVTIDYLIGDPGRVGRGLGTRMISSVLDRTWHDYPDAPAVLAAVVAANAASWRALEKAGMRRVASGDVEPDNPVDEPLHHIYRIDRPASAPSRGERWTETHSERRRGSPAGAGGAAAGRAEPLGLCMQDVDRADDVVGDRGEFGVVVLGHHIAHRPRQPCEGVGEVGPRFGGH
ncbi:MAG: GNAT family N-acetyltransferase [Nocardiopsaceae bacterium]|nr:GNAT family N-acetyltransferase [Nocardiopsaceae bacterium]